MLEPAERDRADEPARVAQRLITFALWAVAVAIVTGWLTLATLHLTDEYRVAHLQGNWIAITEVARTGHLYPPPFDGESLRRNALDASRHPRQRARFRPGR